MNRTAEGIIVSILFALGMAADGANASDSMKGSDPGAAEAAMPMKPSDPKNVKEGANVTPDGGIPPSVLTGELLKVDGKEYVVKDQSGKQVHFQIDERTMMNAHPKVGDKIRAKLEPQGYAYSINLANDSTEAGTPDKQTGRGSKSNLPEPTK